MVDFLYGRVVDAGADVVDAVDPRCYNGNRYLGTRWRQSTHCLHQHSSSLRRNLSISCGAALRCVEIFCWKPLATAAPMSEATITPKIAIQEFSEKQLWQKLWKNALKNDSFWELAYLLIMPLDPVHFSFCFLGAFMLTAKTWHKTNGDAENW